MQRVASPERDRVLGVVGAVATLASGIVWILTLVPGAPLVEAWNWILILTFAAAFPVWFLVVRQLRSQGVPSGPWWLNGFPLEGRRAKVALALMLLALGSFVTGFAIRDAPDEIERDGDVYRGVDDDGRVVAMTRRDWELAEGEDARRFASFTMMFAGVGAMVLLRDEDPPDPFAHDGPIT